MVQPNIPPSSTKDSEARWANDFTFSEQACLVDLVITTADWLERLMGRETVDAALKELWRSAYRVGHCGNEINQAEWDKICSQPWRDTWVNDDTNNPTDEWFAGLPSGARLIRLNQFAFHGFFLAKAESEADLQAKIEDDIAWLAAIVERIPTQWTNQHGEPLSVDDLRQTYLAAKGRLSIDIGRNIAIEELAALAEMKLKTLRNAIYGKSESGPKTEGDGMVTATAAIEWLTLRDNFRPSIWRESIGNSVAVFDGEEAGNAESETDATGEYVFIPVAQDGTEFRPSLRRAQGYQVGMKNNEQFIEDYFDALDFLAHMKKPSWRRPNEERSGRWGIVKADRWIRLAKGLLVAEIANAKPF